MFLSEANIRSTEDPVDSGSGFGILFFLVPAYVLYVQLSNLTTLLQ